MLTQRDDHSINAAGAQGIILKFVQFVLLISDRPGVTMHPAQPDMDFLTK